MILFKRLAHAVCYVTAFPFLQKPSTEQDLAGLSKYLPVVGLIIGSVLLLAQAALHMVSSPYAVSAVLIVIVWVAVTGGIHLDGLMDTADGVLSHRNRERMLEIMRDSRTGNFGAITGILLILCKYAAIESSSTAALSCALFLVPAWARWCEVVVIGCYPYARDEGMGRIWHDTTSVPKDLILGAIFPLIATGIACLSCQLTAVILVTCAATILWGILASIYIYSQLHGQTGDTYGASVEVAEAGGLVACSVAATLLCC